jgi:hypothetical protein
VVGILIVQATYAGESVSAQVVVYKEGKYYDTYSTPLQVSLPLGSYHIEVSYQGITNTADVVFEYDGQVWYLKFDFPTPEQVPTVPSPERPIVVSPPEVIALEKVLIPPAVSYTIRLSIAPALVTYDRVMKGYSRTLIIGTSPAVTVSAKLNAYVNDRPVKSWSILIIDGYAEMNVIPSDYASVGEKVVFQVEDAYGNKSNTVIMEVVEEKVIPPTPTPPTPPTPPKVEIPWGLILLGVIGAVAIATRKKEVKR